MRLRVLCFLACLPACGGKLVPTSDSMLGDAGAPADDNSEPAPVVVTPPPATPVSAARDTSFSCAPATMTTTEFGTIDVSKLECECKSTDDCPRGATCIDFAGLAAPRCTEVEQPCDLLVCSEGSCIPYYGPDKVQPTCVR